MREQESLGPCVARYFASKLWAGEQYFMQIDSHIWFAQNWDEKLRDMIVKAPSSKPVLSTYPPGYGGHWEVRLPKTCFLITCSPCRYLRQITPYLDLLFRE